MRLLEGDTWDTVCVLGVGGVWLRLSVHESDLPCSFYPPDMTPPW